MTILSLDKPLVDWLTLTGDSHIDIVATFNKWLDTTKDTYLRSNSKRWLQFKGTEFYFTNGTAYAGDAVIKNKDWQAVYFSGELCQEALYYFQPLVDMGILECKRIDIQATIQQPTDWEQIRFLNRMQVKGKKPEMRQSIDKATGKALMTVAVGSRTSEVYARCYQKITNGGELLLRFEGEYKGAKAVSVLSDMKKYTPSSMLWHHVQKLKDSQLENAFANAFNGISPHNARPQVKTRDKRREWLLTACLPAFAEFVNSHDDDGQVQAAFLEVLYDAGFTL